MKILTLISHASAQQDLADKLRTIKQVPGFTFTHVEGHGVQSESDPFLSARDKVVGYMPRVRVDILLEDSHVEQVLEMLRNADNTAIGHSVYWVSAVDQGGHL
jgi:nitrogen regulatory protein P-II 1